MKRLPTSWGDMLSTVIRVNHPEIEDVHKIWLMGVALNASENGKNSYPGYDTLSEITGRGPERQRYYSRRCEELGLVELVRRGNGKGIANEYRICLEHPAYPESYGARKTPRVGEGESIGKTPRVGEGERETKTPRVGEGESIQNPSSTNAKPLVSGGKTPRVGEGPTNKTPKETPNTETAVAGGFPLGLSTTVGSREKLFDVFIDMEKQYPQTTKKQDAEIDKLIERYGLENAIPLMKRYLRTSPYRLIKGEETKWPLAWFIKTFEKELRVVEREKRNAITPEQVAEMNALTTQRRNDFFNVAPENKPEPDADALFAETHNTDVSS